MDFLNKIHFPWEIKNGKVYSKDCWIMDKKRLCIYNAFKINVLTWMGVYPEAGPLWICILKRFLGYFAMFSSAHLVFSSGYSLYLSLGDVEEMGDYFYLFVLSSDCLLNQFYLRYNYKNLGILFEIIEDNFDAWPVRNAKDFKPPITIEELREKGLKAEPTDKKHPAEPLFTSNLLKMNKYIAIYVASIEFVASIYFVKPFLNKSIPGHRHLPHKGYFLIDEQQSPWFELLFVFLVYGAFINATFAGFPIYVMVDFCKFLTIHIQALQIHLESLHTTGNHNFTEELIKCIKHHKKIIKFADFLENLMNKFLLMVYFIFLLLISFILLRTSIVTDIYDIEFFTMTNVLIISTITLFYGCYMPQDTTDESLKLNDSLYFTNWYQESAKNQTLVKLFYNGIKKPLIFTAGKFVDMSIPTWIGIVKAAYSFYTLMNQGMEEE